MAVATFMDAFDDIDLEKAACALNAIAEDMFLTKLEKTYFFTEARKRLAEQDICLNILL